mmetsp:Transcript_5464/g.8003  ORF Transcript_5464/g.8003 Transcript_5464/m.8003 type:complete len:281 (-) Transcript_5464:860-1702(-)
MAAEALSCRNEGESIEEKVTDDSPKNGFKVTVESNSAGGYFDLTHESTSRSATNRRITQARKKTTSVKNTRSTSPDVAQRRVVKATPPPPLSASEISPEDGDSSSFPGDNGEDEREFRGLVPAKARSVEDEAKKWRQQRFDAAAALSKEKKEKSLDQKRKLKVDSGEAASEEETTATTPVRKEPLPAILRVQSKFPEHKRTVETASLPPDEAPSEKRIKTVDMKEDNVDGKDNVGTALGDEEGGLSYWTDGISKLAKKVVPAVAVAAILAIAAMKLTKRK